MVRDRMRVIVDQFTKAKEFIDIRLSGCGDVDMTEHGRRIYDYIGREEQAEEARTFYLLSLFPPFVN